MLSDWQRILLLVLSALKPRLLTKRKDACISFSQHIKYTLINTENHLPPEASHSNQSFFQLLFQSSFCSSIYQTLLNQHTL